MRKALPLVLWLPLLAQAVCAQTAIWSQRTVATNPTLPFEAALAHDPVRGRTVLYGGQVSVSATWEFDGTNWAQLTPATRPPSENPASDAWYQVAAYDTVHHQLVLVDSKPNTGTQTWRWDGTNWTMLSTGGPSGRRHFAMAFDAVRGVLVLFGGHGSASNIPLGDTWEWDGSQWQQRGTGGPPPRSSQGMAYDSNRHVVVLFGGEGQYRLGDTWEWDGISWREYFGIAGPPARCGHSMAFDSGRGRTVVSGGTDRVNTNFNDTWEWDGIQWTHIQPTTIPNSFQWRSMAFDAGRQRMVVYDGQTWEYQVLAPVVASYVPFGTGCAGPAGTPDLATVGGSLPRLGTTLQLRLSNIPASVFNLPFGVVGFSNTTWGSLPLPADLAFLGMPGCTAWTSADVSVTLTNSSGTANWPIAIPNQVQLIGLDFFTQCVVTAPGVNSAGLIVSNAGHGVVGTQ